MKPTKIRHTHLEQIQRVWFEATTRRKIDFSQLPYLLETKKKKGMQKEELNTWKMQTFLKLRRR